MKKLKIQENENIITMTDEEMRIVMYALGCYKHTTERNL